MAQRERLALQNASEAIHLGGEMRMNHGRCLRDEPEMSQSTRARDEEQKVLPKSNHASTTSLRDADLPIYNTFTKRKK